MLPIKQIYVSSRYKTPDSVSNRNFMFELPYTLAMPRNAIFILLMYVSQICLKPLVKMKMIDYMCYLDLVPHWFWQP